MASSDTRINCWEYRRCGRGPADTAGKARAVCRAATEEALSGVNHGERAGRACWAAAGSLAVDMGGCGFGRCGECGFRQLVSIEEATDFLDTDAILERVGYSPLLGMCGHPDGDSRDDQA